MAHPSLNSDESSSTAHGSTIHHGPPSAGRPYKCTKCPSKFKSQGNLREHERIHTGEKPFLCEHCGELFRQSSHLVRHRRTHTSQSPFACGECGKCFRQPGGLKKHQGTLAKCSLKYAGPGRGGRFGRLPDSYAHQHECHGGKAYSCAKCPVRFKTAEAHTKHEVVHNEEYPVAREERSATPNERSRLERHESLHDDQYWPKIITLEPGAKPWILVSLNYISSQGQASPDPIF